jgi:hypothetical protein
MANCVEFVDLKATIAALDLKMAQDYAVVYDSTMARFWFFNERARRSIVQHLQQVPQGRIIPDEELEQLHTLFPDRYFGELVFLVREGALIVPSHMGERRPAQLRSFADQSNQHSPGRHRHHRPFSPHDSRCGTGQGGQRIRNKYSPGRASCFPSSRSRRSGRNLTDLTHHTKK